MNKDLKEDIVDHPKHYISDSGIETIDVIEAFTKDLDPFEAYCTGNIIKYICRWKHKNGVEDLKKARWYINKLLGESENSSDNIIKSDFSSEYDKIIDGVFGENDRLVMSLKNIDWANIKRINVTENGITVRSYYGSNNIFYGTPF